MLVVVLGMMLAAGDGPPPYPETLACAGLSRAWSERQPAASSAEAGDARNRAEFWAFAAMDAARRAGLTASVAEADQIEARDEALARFVKDQDAAERDLLQCQKMIPAGAR